MEFQEKENIDILIEGCRKGNHNAQMQIYTLYYKAMYNTSLRILNNPTEAEDIMQDAFLLAFTKINNFIGEVSFGAWLKKIVINKSLDELRKRKAFFEDVDSVVVMTTDDEENLDELHANVELIKQGIKDLPEGYRIIMSLYLIEGYDHEEIGEILMISPSTSRSQYTRAKKKLREMIVSKVKIA